MRTMSVYSSSFCSIASMSQSLVYWLMTNFIKKNMTTSKSMKILQPGPYPFGKLPSLSLIYSPLMILIQTARYKYTRQKPI